MTPRMRVGTVRYLNAAPLTSHLPGDAFEVVADHPRGISEALRQGAVDLALAPVAAVLGQPDLRVLGGVCIGAHGPVRSVLLVAETPPEAWTEVRLDGESRTSVVLARLLAARSPLAARLRPDLRWIEVAPGAAPAEARDTVAAVVIGDAARALPERFTVRLDLAALWTEWTGLPFVFAVWAGRPSVPEAARAAVVQAGKAGVAAIASRWSGDDADYLTHAIRYPLDEPALMGLRRFAALAAAEGLLPEAPVRLYDPPRHRRATPSLEATLADAAQGVPPPDPLRLLMDADRASLTMAAHVRRASLHPASVATYLVADEAGGVEAPPPPHAAARYGRAPHPDLPTAALGAWHPGATALVWRAGAPLPPLPSDTVVHADLGLDDPSDAAFIAELAAVRALGARVLSAAVHLPLPVGSLVEPSRPTPDRWLRRISVARLALETPHIVASPHTQGLDLSQLALCCGADDLGPVGPGRHPIPGAARFDAALEAAERALRVAGFVAVRRDLRFSAVGEALTRLRTVRRPEERARP